MRCPDVRELADSFLSGQLLVETNHELVRHLETCADCRHNLARRRELRDRLQGALSRAHHLRPRPGFREELVAALHPPEATLTRRSLLQSSWWAVAAGVAASAGGGLSIWRIHSRESLKTLALQAAGNHRNCAVAFHLDEQPIRLDEAGRRYGAPYAALASFQVRATGRTVEEIDRHACVYEGQRFGHLVFRSNGALTSLLVTAGPAPGEPQVEQDAGGLQVASLRAGRFLGFVVSDAAPADVLQLAQDLTGPLSRHLS